MPPHWDPNSRWPGPTNFRVANGRGPLGFGEILRKQTKQTKISLLSSVFILGGGIKLLTYLFWGNQAMQMYGMYGKIEGVWVGNILTPVLGGGKKPKPMGFFRKNSPKVR